MNQVIKNIAFFLFIGIIMFTISCENEPVEAVTANADEVIKVDSELYTLVERVASDEGVEDDIACIEFIYAFTIFIFDEELTLIGSEVIGDDAEFSSFLGSLEEGYSIGLNYPITSTLDDGTVISINNNEELQQSIDQCVREEILGYCNGLLVECVWEVDYPQTLDPPYPNAYFEMEGDGTVTFHHDNQEYLGTWIALFIEDELHINITVIASDEIEAYWNRDWPAIIQDENTIVLTNGNDSVTLNQNCETPPVCSGLTFSVCEDTPGFAQFALDEYISCILYIEGIADASDLSVTFYQTLADAQNNTNQIISGSPYINTTNPQTLYVRIENIVTSDTSFTEIELVANNC